MAKARLFWTGFSRKCDHSQAEVLKRLRQRDLVEFCAGTVRHRSSIENEILDEPLIHHYDALFARYERAIDDFSGIIDKHTYLLFAPFEGETLRMMDRLHDPYVGRVFHDSYEERRQMFLRHCTFWSHYLANRRITHCVFNGVPHEVYDFVILNLATLLNIRTIIVHQEKSGRSRAVDTPRGQAPASTMNLSGFFVSENLADIGSWVLAKRIKEVGNSMDLNFVCSSDLRNVVTAEKFFSETGGQSVTSKRFNYGLARKDLQNQLKKPRSFLLVLHRIIRVVAQRHKHKIIATEKSQSQNIILYTLPFQPEESSSPRGGIFTEQLLVLKLLSEAVPDGWSIRVREHPDQYWRLRPRASRFWREVVVIPRVSVTPLSESFFDSYKSARAVACVSGSSAVECWIHSIPILLFGNMFLKLAPGVFPISTLNDLKNACSIIENGLTVKRSEIDDFISWTDDHTFVGHLGKIVGRETTTAAATTDNLESILTSWLALSESNFD